MKKLLTPRAIKRRKTFNPIVFKSRGDPLSFFARHGPCNCSMLLVYYKSSLNFTLQGEFLYSFSSVAYVWVCEAKLLGRLQKHFVFLKSNFYVRENF
jgi:hypothetical protein